MLPLTLAAGLLAMAAIVVAAAGALMRTLAVVGTAVITMLGAVRSATARAATALIAGICGPTAARLAAAQLVVHTRVPQLVELLRAAAWLPSQLLALPSAPSRVLHHWLVAAVSLTQATPASSG